MNGTSWVIVILFIALVTIVLFTAWDCYLAFNPPVANNATQTERSNIVFCYAGRAFIEALIGGGLWWVITKIK